MLISDARRTLRASFASSLPTPQPSSHRLPNLIDALFKFCFLGLKRRAPMGRPEPCVLFAQSFFHSQLDEYVDEVIFAEPIVITACEFLEQNASSSAPNIPVTGATSPPSFALEIFVHCEGESRFRRLCQPFLYSHSSSNVLEVEAIVTNHLVVRGSYRNLTLVVYGNTAEDLGQFNIEADLDNSLVNVVSTPSEGKFEDLPPALWSTKLTFDESIYSLQYINFPFPELDGPPEIRPFLALTIKICQVFDDEAAVLNVINAVVSAVSSYAMNSGGRINFCRDQDVLVSLSGGKLDMQQIVHVVDEATTKLLEFCKDRTLLADDLSMEDITILGSKAGAPSWGMLVDMFNKCQFFSETSPNEVLFVSKNKSMALGLGLALLMCSSMEGCFHFVNSGAMEQIVSEFHHCVQCSVAITLLLLNFVERATRHGIGCEGFLGWLPREDHHDIPSGNSNGYCYLLKLLLEKPRHDVASLATHLLQRLRLYEIACRYESAVLSLLANLPHDCGIAADQISSLLTASSQLKDIVNFIDLIGPIEDPSPVSFAIKLSFSGQSEGLLSYKSTFNCIAASKYSFTQGDIDACSLSLLKERGFFPLSAALLSSPMVCPTNGSTADIFMDIAALIESILLYLLFHRSGLSFLLSQPEASEIIIHALRGAEDMPKIECMTSRQAAVFLSKGFICRPHEIAMIVELHLKVGIAIDQLLATTPQSDELLWVLWELCAISRSECGRQALLTLSQFPEAMSVLLDALRSYKDLETVAAYSGSSSLGLAIFHSASEIFEVVVTDPTASSLRSWLGHAMELHKALHSSSRGSNRKDAPTRLLEWIDAGVVYQRNGADGLLRYAAVLASGGDAHLSSASVLVSDSLDVENVVGDSTNNSDTRVLDNLIGKLVSDKYFDGVALPNTSIVQLTTAFRILAFISEDPAVAASLFEEGGLNLVYVVLVNCKLMLERLSNSYDYLVDEGADYNSTTDLLLDRSLEQNLIDLLIPCLLLLINVLKRLQEAKEQYRNKKLLNALLRLHREVSPRLAACAAGLCFPYPSSALGFGAVCHLLTSVLASWPVFGWTPGLFHCVLETVQATSVQALGPKDACSMFCLLGDLFPDEGIWYWTNEMPPLSAIRSLSLGAMLGPCAERDINWYLQPEHVKVLLVRLTPQLDRIAQIVLHFAFSALVVIQDMLRVFIIRIACQRMEYAVSLLRPIISWMDNHIDDTSNETSLTDMEIFKVYQLLLFVAGLLEHPCAKALLIEMNAVRILRKVLMACTGTSKLDGNLICESSDSSKSVTLCSLYVPVLKSLASLFSNQSTSRPAQSIEMCSNDNISFEECFFILRHLIKLCKVLTVGMELLVCLVTFKELISWSQSRNALAYIVSRIQPSAQDEQDLDQKNFDVYMSNKYDWWCSSPFLICLENLLKSLDSKDHDLTIIIEILCALSISAQCLSMGHDKANGVFLLKYLFGLPTYVDDATVASNEKLNKVKDIINKFERKLDEEENLSSLIGKTKLYQVKEFVKSMFNLLQKPAGSSPKSEGIVAEESDCPTDVSQSAFATSELAQSSLMSIHNEPELSFPNVLKLNQDGEQANSHLLLGRFAEKFMWECSDSSLDRQLTPAKRKLALAEGSGRRLRENAGSEAIGSSAFSRGISTPNVSSGPTRRDTFRQRKPNTSRPPSMHVDDYVARERNIDGASSGSNIINSSHRGGSGRPPSIHVDEFMARQREKQNPMFVIVGDASQAKNTRHMIVNDSIKLDKPQQLKTNLDDDLQEIDIVFDEESDSDDRLLFPQPDENLNPPTVIGESSSTSLVEETGESNDNTRFTNLNAPLPAKDEGLHSQRSDMQSESPVPQQPNVFSTKTFRGIGLRKSSFHEQTEESNYASPSGSNAHNLQALVNVTGFSSRHGVSNASSSVQSFAPPRFHHSNSTQKSTDNILPSRAYGERKLMNHQPPLPPTPPPAMLSAQANEPNQIHASSFVNSVRDIKPPVPSGYPPHAFDAGGNNSNAALNGQSENPLSVGNASSSSNQARMDSRFTINLGSVSKPTLETSVRPMPPLPPLPPPFSNPMSHSPTTGAQVPSSNQMTSIGAQPPMPNTALADSSLGIFSASGTNLTYALSPYAPSLIISRPASTPATFFGSPALQNAQNFSSFSMPTSVSQPALQPIQPRPPPPPLPQHPRPSHHPGPPIQLSQSQSEQLMPFQHGSVQVKVNPLQIPQQVQIPQLQLYYQTQHPESLSNPIQSLLEQTPPESHNIQADSTSQQQKDSGMTLQQYFSSPEAIQSLLSDRDKLCQLLEQHPKLMQMLQERLGQQ